MKSRKNIVKETSILLIITLVLCSTLGVSGNSSPLTLSSKAETVHHIFTSNENNRGEIIWENGETSPNAYSYSSQLEHIIPFVSQVADDFQFEVDMLITDVHWYGGFWAGNGFDPCDFWIYFYADDGTGNAPTGAGLPDPSPTALWSDFYQGVSGLPLDPNGFYSYHVVLNQPFRATAGLKYWVVFQAVFPFPPQWGWTNTVDTRLHTAVQGFPFSYEPFWTDIFVDMAFFFTGEPINPTKPDISCQGLLGWDTVRPGDTVYGTFQVGNTGENYSFLNWEVESWPSWGSWTFSPNTGTTLPKGEWVTVNVTVTAPPDKKTNFTGTVKIINYDDPTDFCEIPVYLHTPLNQGMLGSSFFAWLFARFPHAFPILRHLFGYKQTPLFVSFPD